MNDFDAKMTEIGLRLQIHALKQENAALREDKERLDWLCSDQCLWERWRVDDKIVTRQLIDSSRKRAMR